MVAIDLVERSGWRARRRRGEVPLYHQPRGVKVHYVGGHVDPRLADPGEHARCVGLVRAIQADHMTNRNWVDIGYTACVCPHQKVLVGRGPGILPAANGPGLNEGHYAVLGLVGDSGLEIPPDRMLHGIVDAIEWLRREGAGGEVKRHKDGYDTTCPGPFLSAWVKAGARRPSTDPAQPPAAPAWPGRTLAYPPLMRGEDVERWQRRMRARGWALEVDGVFGPRSREVAHAFQREKGLKATARVNRSTWEAAWSAPIT